MSVQLIQQYYAKVEQMIRYGGTAQQIMDYNILDFSKWEDEEEFEKMFRKLVEGLDLFYKEG